MKLSLIIAAVLGLGLLTGCPRQVDPANTTNTGYGHGTEGWGTPDTHTTTAGFNGSPSEMAGDKSNSGAPQQKK